MQGVFNPNIPIFPPNSAEGLYFCFSFIVSVVVKSYFMFLLMCTVTLICLLASRHASFTKSAAPQQKRLAILAAMTLTFHVVLPIIHTLKWGATKCFMSVFHLMKRKLNCSIYIIHIQIAIYCIHIFQMSLKDTV